AATARWVFRRQHLPARITGGKVAFDSIECWHVDGWSSDRLAGVPVDHRSVVLVALEAGAPERVVRLAAGCQTGSSSSRYLASGPIRCRVSGRIRAAWSRAALPCRGMNAPCTDRRPRLDRFAANPCHVDP